MPLPKWMSSKAKLQRQNRRSRNQERQRASEVGGRERAGSGSSWRAPQDVITATHLEQLKYTDHAVAVIKASELNKLDADATNAGKLPRLVVEFKRHGIRLVCDVECERF